MFRIMGYYPGDDWFTHWSRIPAFFIQYFGQMWLFYWEVRYSVISWSEGELMAGLESFCPAPSRLAALLKCLYLIAQRKRLRKLINRLQELFNRKESLEIPSNQWATYWGYQFTYWELLFTNLTCWFFITLPVVAMVYHSMKEPDEPRIFLFPIRLDLPFEYRKSPLFEICYVIVCYLGYTVILLMAGSDGLFIGSCLLISSQYRIVQRQLQALGDNEWPAATASKDNYSDEVENERIFEQLKLITQRHKQTIDITSEMSDLFQPNVFASITIASIKIGLACITLMKAEGFGKLKFIWYTLGVLTEIFVYSYGGTHLMEESERIGDSAYDFPWYRYRKDVRQLIQLMMIRAQKPSRIEVPFFEASFVTFSTILQTAGSYVTLMQTFVEN
ncbi:odorant receptor 10a-like [Toxorhynchites rutilus septentrionalis]|uniref:odorant receptor 10a-like n=1 Tax=Toxorhynchites rutilus septentrionalis TaxID=329112 RepID=UPI0024786784|nr:odorant receptor 10a-like [Toxorhynchites rutilus septentrionalis]